MSTSVQHPSSPSAARAAAFRAIFAERIAILDNFCMGNPDDEKELGALVETVKGVAITAEAYGAPFVSCKESFYNYFKTDEGPVSIPCTLSLSGFGVVEKP